MKSKGRFRDVFKLCIGILEFLENYYRPIMSEVEVNVWKKASPSYLDNLIHLGTIGTSFCTLDLT